MLHIFRSNDFLDLGLAVITVCKSTEKRFRATMLDFKDKYTHELHTLCCSRSQNSASGGSNTFALFQRSTWQSASCGAGCNLWSHIAMSRYQKLMLLRCRFIKPLCISGGYTSGTLGSRKQPRSNVDIRPAQIHPVWTPRQLWPHVIKVFTNWEEKKGNINNKDVTLCPPPEREHASGSPPTDETSVWRQSFGLWAPGRGTKK